MPVWLHHIETIVPETSYSQEYAGERMQQLYSDERTKRIIRAIYKKSGIEKRHSVVGNFVGPGEESFLKVGPGGTIVEPGTAARNEMFAREAQALSVKLARNAMERCPGIEPREISHVITVSCTGFHNPGADYHIVRELGLSRSTQRFHLGFMGCYAAISGLNMAAQFCAADPEAVVLMVCIELCSLHLQLKQDEDSLMANAIFADGAGCAIVSARDPGGDRRVFRAGDFRSTVVPEGEMDMAWSIGNSGFSMTLSSYVPRIIGATIGELIEPALARSAMRVGDVHTWAVHPGGKAIIDRVQESLGLTDQQVEASRKVLRLYGNMSSATILFVLEEILRRSPPGKEEEVFAIAFGPGLTVETAHLTAQGVVTREPVP